MKLGREVSRHNELDNWRNTHRFESVMATKWLLLTISETEPGLWDRLLCLGISISADRSHSALASSGGLSSSDADSCLLSHGTSYRWYRARM